MTKLFDFLYRFRWFVLTFFLIVIGITAFLSFSLKGQVAELIFQKKEAARPAEIDLITITTPDCLQCKQVSGFFLRNLQRLNIKLASQKELSFGAKDAQGLIDKFGIKKVPALILSGEIKKDAQLEKTLLSLGKEKQDSVVIEAVSPPYQKIDTKEIVGKFKLIYLTDESCSQCYDVKVHKRILASFGMFPFEEVSIDQNSSEGRRVINQYGITKVPTILLRGDLDEYARFQQVWESVGRVTSDNTYVFEALDQMGTYYDLTFNKIIEPAQKGRK